MADLIKNRYNYESLHEVAVDIKSVYGTFQVEEFLNATIDDLWDSLELKQRIRKISSTLGEYLPEEYSEAIGIIDKVVMNYGSWLDGFCGFFPDFVEVYGQKDRDWDISMGALERYTQYASAEFAVRTFIIKDAQRMMAKMIQWSKNDNEHVRRLSSEGCRPALPWGQSIPDFKKDPTPILPILEQLKNDSSIHVRKSVANNLNDISKTHPNLVLLIAGDWYGEHEETDWIIKHGCRTLLKKGNREALNIFGYGDGSAITIEGFNLDEFTISIGENISFSFIAYAKQSTKTRLEYGIDYVKASGKRNRKIFKISEILLDENTRKSYIKKHSFADVSVRKHHPGIHSITLIVNGVEQGTLDFELLP